MKKDLSRVLLVLSMTLAVLGGSFSISYADQLSAMLNTVASNDVTIGEPGYYIGYLESAESLLYKPSSSHNICSVTVGLRRYGPQYDSVQLRAYLSPMNPGTAINISTPVYGSGYPQNSTFIRSADTSWQISSTMTAYTYNFTPCLTVVGSNFYWFEFTRTILTTASSTSYYSVGGYVDGIGSTYGFTGAEDANNWGFANAIGFPNPGTPNFPGSHSLMNVILNGTQNYGAATPSSTPQFAQTVINNLLGITDQNASTSTASGIASYGNVPAYFANRVPFGYIYDIYKAWNNVSTSSTEFATISINFSSIAVSSTTKSFLPPSVTLFSTSTVTQYVSSTMLDLLNLLASSAIAVTWAMMLFKRVTGSSITTS